MDKVTEKEMNGNHEPSVVERTADIQVADDFTFSKFMLSEKLLKSLSKLNFVKPSPIQLKVIPLARCGLDMIMQAKSGTGKTLAFAICLLENYNADLKFPQSLVIVPTREIAVQIVGVLNELGRNQKHFKACEFIGGSEIANDRKNIQSTKVIVGTPGRVLHLINNQIFNVSNIKTLVLDEADKLLESGQMAKDVTAILSAMERKIQILAATATVTEHMEKTLKRSMKNPIGITPKHEIPVLLGIKQFVKVFPRENDNIALMNAKVDELMNIFKRVTFKQCLLFTDSQTKTESYCSYLNKRGWKSEVISGAQEQSKRLEVLEKLVTFKCRTLVTTDLMARGIDVETINLIVNLDLPYDCFTYLHRIGRAGRFGSHGIAITFVNGEEELPKFQKILGDIGGESLKALILPHESSNYDFWNFDEKIEESLEKVAGIPNNKEDKSSKASVSLPEEDETKMNNLALLEIARKLVDTKAETKAFNLNEIIEDYEKSSSGCHSINHKVVEDSTDINENIFSKAIEDLNLYDDEDEDKSSKANVTEKKEVRTVIFNRTACDEDEILSSNNEVESSDEDELESNDKDELESSEEEGEAEEEYEAAQEVNATQKERYATQGPTTQRASCSSSNLTNQYDQYVASNYSKWENIFHFQLANIQSYLQSVKK